MRTFDAKNLPWLRYLSTDFCLPSRLCGKTSDFFSCYLSIACSIYKRQAGGNSSWEWPASRRANPSAPLSRSRVTMPAYPPRAAPWRGVFAVPDRDAGRHLCLPREAARRALSPSAHAWNMSRMGSSGVLRHKCSLRHSSIQARPFVRVSRRLREFDPA